MYLVTAPWLLKKIYSRCIWEMPADGNRVYLSFDDGPHPEATPLVLDLLARFNAKATFFCIGKNVERYPHLFARIVDEGHAVGNHTHRHMNGWKHTDSDYFADIRKAAEHIPSMLFRPPYGRIRLRQARALEAIGMRPVMWSVLSGDFDIAISGAKCADNVMKNMRPGSIIVFHDSQKAMPRMQYALPLVLEEIYKRGWVAEKL
jgi:peptidoglycan/xylan/chitin deacetylase (PgdA/CDA1 family)